MERDRTYLDTDARIIAEDETHVAIALRLRKDLIAHHMPLLAALADRLPAPIGPRACPAKH